MKACTYTVRTVYSKHSTTWEDGRLLEKFHDVVFLVDIITYKSKHDSSWDYLSKFLNTFILFLHFVIKIYWN